MSQFNKHDHHGHGGSNDGSVPQSPTYRSWAAMITRCTNPKRRNYKRYGGRGIKVCDRWSVFSAFLVDMGERPDGTSLDRRDPNGHYEPRNCRWATPVEQRANRRVVKLEAHEFDQVRWLASLGYPRIQIAKFFDVSASYVYGITNGWSRRRWSNSL